VDYLADDYEVGNRIAMQGLEVKLSEVVVETFLPPYTLHQFFEHQLRWARSVRDSRRWGYLGLALTFGLVWALLTLILAGGAGWAWGLLAGVVAARLGVAILVGRFVLRDAQLGKLLPLIPLRDLFALLIWMASFAGHNVAWRGDFFRLKDGKLVRINS
jgi:ceramide glucosyltransferase